MNARRKWRPSWLDDATPAAAPPPPPAAESAESDRGFAEAVAAGVDWTDWDLADEGVDVEGLLQGPSKGLSWEESTADLTARNARVYATPAAKKSKTKQAPTMYDA